VKAEREVLLTLTDDQHQELTHAIACIRRQTGAASNTAVILEAVRQKADATASSATRKATA
jgi:hypothetical protein